MTDIDIDALLAEAAHPEKTVSVCLRGDLRAEWETLSEQLAERSKQDRTSLSDDGGRQVAEQMDALAEQMRASTVEVRLRAMSRRDWRRLTQDHPPVTEDDKSLGFAQDTFWDALIGACLVSPEMSDEQLSRMLDQLTSAQFDELATTAWALNRRDVDVPFSRAVSLITQDSGETSKQQSGSGSRSNAGKAGSRSKSRSTSTTKKGGSSGR